ncbi:MAG: hypothetical protein KUG81_04145 [Gammaproteobacteria bacterium]|nr:hypothetical protein [Gammaproteobacteria bacterium]
MALSIKDRVGVRIKEHFYNTTKSIKCKNVQGLFNHRCMHNAVQYASKRDGVKVIMGVTFYKNSTHPVLHYWCKDLDGEHLEVTIGYQAEDTTYYPMKEIAKGDWHMMQGVFEDALEYLMSTHTHWHEYKWLKFRKERVA